MFHRGVSDPTFAPLSERNVELKARLADPTAALRAALELGATDHGTLVQRDTYFHVPSGRLKLREIEGAGAELIAYLRPDAREPEASTFVRAPLGPHPAAVLAALEASLGIRGVVAKRRRLLVWRSVRIHLDDVAGLGSFLEFEAMLGPDSTEQQGHERIATLRHALQISDGDLIAVGYADLLLGEEREDPVEHR